MLFLEPRVGDRPGHPHAAQVKKVKTLIKNKKYPPDGSRENQCERTKTGWVPEGSLAVFGGAFLRSRRPRGPGKALQNAGGEAPHIFEGLPGPPGPARPQKRTTQKIRPRCLQVPRRACGPGPLDPVFGPFGQAWGPSRPQNPATDPAQLGSIGRSRKRAGGVPRGDGLLT